MKGTHVRSLLYRHCRGKSWSCTEPLHKAFEHKWVWENFRVDYCTPALFARDNMELFGYYFDSRLSDRLLWYVLFHNIDQPFSQTVPCNQHLNCELLIIQCLACPWALLPLPFASNPGPHRLRVCGLIHRATTAPQIIKFQINGDLIIVWIVGKVICIPQAGRKQRWWLMPAAWPRPAGASLTPGCGLLSEPWRVEWCMIPPLPQTSLQL